jgi:hypothetical protein
MRRANTAKNKPETTMTRFFIAGVAVLLLATGAAHAGMCSLWQCGNVKVQACAIHEWNGGGYEISFSRLQSPTTHKFKWDYVRGTASLNRKRCNELDTATEKPLK